MTFCAMRYNARCGGRQGQDARASARIREQLKKGADRDRAKERDRA